MMGLALSCAWCGKPLVDVENAKTHVRDQCEVAPWRKETAELRQNVIRLDRELAGALDEAGRWKMKADAACACPAEAKLAELERAVAGGWTVRDGVLHPDWRLVALDLTGELYKREKGTEIVDFVTAIVRRHSPPAVAQ